MKKNSKGNTILRVAVMVGTSSLVRLLIDHAKKLDIESGGGQLLSMLNLYGDTTLHVAMRYGKSEIVKVLIKEDPELAMCVNNDGESTLRHGFSYPKCCSRLLLCWKAWHECLACIRYSHKYL